MSAHDFTVVICIAAAFCAFGVSLAGVVFYSSRK